MDQTLVKTMGMYLFILARTAVTSSELMLTQSVGLLDGMPKVQGDAGWGEDSRMSSPW